MDRPALDAFTRQHRLAAPAVAAALALTGARPDTTAWRRFATALLHAAGLGAIGAGMLFFVAANWQDYGVFGRFALLQTALLACIVVALWRPPPAQPGQAALILATLLTGGLLALFGQSYQTGADVHELFFAWSLLALPFALAGLSGALWAVWWTVLNVALALLCGWLGPDHFFWRFVDGRHLDRAALLMLPCVVNLLGAAGFAALRRTRRATAAPAWLPRGLASAAFAYGTAAVIAVVTQGHRYRGPNAIDAGSGADAAVVLLFAALSAGLALATWRRRRDVFPMALIAASWIAISTTWLANTMRLNDLGAFFLIAAWLVGASTASGLLLMHWVRAWRAEPTPSAEGATA
jgi:uncharacterized membrane protein